MSYNSNLPADTTAPAEIRENFRALKEDKIVAAATAITAESADKLANARMISLVGDATGSVNFDGSADVSIAVDVLSADTSAQCTGNAATATKLETARKINGVAFDGSADITITAAANGGNADTVDGKHAVDFAPAGYIPPNATKTTDGSMSATDKTKLDGIEAGAQVNQNAFSNVVVNGTTIHADNPTDTIELAGGTNIALTANATSKKVSIGVVGKVASAAQADTAANATNAVYATSAGNADTLDGHHWSEVQTAITANNFDAGHSFGATGYQKLASGLILQWGALTTPDHSYQTNYNFPIPFPTMAVSIDVNATNTTVNYGITNKSTFYIDHPYGTSYVTWSAIGF